MPKSKPLKSFAERLLHLRLDVLGMTQREFWRRINNKLPEEDSLRSPSSLYNFEVGESSPRVGWLVGLKHAFPAVSLDWLLFGAGPPLLDEGKAANAAANLSVLKTIDFGERERLKDLVEGGFPEGLPSHAAAVLSNFQSRLWEADRWYQGVGRDEEGELVRETPSAVWEVWAAVGEAVSVPFRYPDHFVGPEELNEPEAVAYIHGMVAALSPLVRAFRRFRSVTPDPEREPLGPPVPRVRRAEGQYRFSGEDKDE